MVNIDNAMRITLAQCWRQNLHVASQHNTFGLLFIDQAGNFGKRRFLVFRVHRYMMEGNTVPLDHAAQVIMIGDDATDLAVQFAAVPTV